MGKRDKKILDILGCHRNYETTYTVIDEVIQTATTYNKEYEAEFTITDVSAPITGKVTRQTCQNVIYRLRDKGILSQCGKEKQSKLFRFTEKGVEFIELFEAELSR